MTTAAELARLLPGWPCPKCGEPAMYYVNLGSISRDQCRACGFLDMFPWERTNVKADPDESERLDD